MTVIQKYLTAILGVFTVGAGGLAALLAALSAPTVTPLTAWVASLSYLVLIVGAIATYWVPLLPGTWQGRAKTGIAIVAALITFGIQFIVPDFNPVTQIPVIAVGVLNILTTQLGVIIRTDDSRTLTEREADLQAGRPA